MSVKDRMLLDEVQRRFPLCARPYARLGEKLMLSEDRVLGRLRTLRANSAIRRIGPVFDAESNELTSILVALSVPASQVRRAAERINLFEGVTHNYLRRHPLNIWFTLTCRDVSEQRAVLDSIKRDVAPRRYLELPSKRFFKRGVIFDIGLPGEKQQKAIRRKDCRRLRAARRSAPLMSLSIGRLASDLPLVARPFERGSLRAIRVLMAAGRIRRFGAILDGRRVGYRFNALVAWKAGPRRIAEAGRRLASFAQVSHCYERTRYGSWPYGLYTMIHARDRARGRELIAAMARASGIADYAVLETVRELKRSSVRPA